MSLQSRILELLATRALAPRSLYWLLRQHDREAVDAALKDLRQTGRVVLVQGRFERPRQATGAEPPTQSAPSIKRRGSRQRRSPAATFGDPLTSRELTVATVAAEGGTAKVIAAQLGITPHTLHGHLSSIYAKWGIAGKAQLVERLRAEEAA